MEALRDQPWGVAAVCGGMCSCATCHVFIDEAWLAQLPPRDVDEEDLVDMLEFEAPNSRLSCQLRLGEQHDGLQLELAPEE
ncbi:2Fe-2S iron-sulfur cluster binding domain-containing protein [Marinihelvus fidelis]|uniref:2Fe-2S iron-sulfur cluster binding domain-containing protein n=2 Tax=Marinihelvus fidelis TaxID=2613842 RepID=A0A5N0T7N4_9GAMM|nr:2Fe-2S iron-sulfur cluster binding domain-containing protein [Marinihelvus fidelis]